MLKTENGTIVPKFDEVETYQNVTVQILRNSKTGETSVGWCRQPNTIEGGDEYIPKVKDEEKESTLKLGNFKFIAVDDKSSGLKTIKLIHKIRPKRRRNK